MMNPSRDSEPIAARREGTPVMAPTKPSDFRTLLRQYRAQAGLTQEALVERAGLSACMRQYLSCDRVHRVTNLPRPTGSHRAERCARTVGGRGASAAPSRGPMSLRRPRLPHPGRRR